MKDDEVDHGSALPRGCSQVFGAADVAAVFDKKATVWATKRGYGEIVGNDQPLEDLVPVLIPAGSTVADFGCGDGRFARFLAQKCRPAHLYLLDISRQMIAQAVARFRDLTPRRWTPIVGDASAIPLPSAACDATILRQVLHHAQQPLGIMREVQRILKPRGVALALVPGPGYLEAWHHFEGTHDRDPIGRFSPDEVVKLCFDSGLSADIQRHEFTFRFKNLLEVFLRLEATVVLQRVVGYRASSQYFAELLESVLATSILASTGPVEVSAEYLVLIARKESHA